MRKHPRPPSGWTLLIAATTVAALLTTAHADAQTSMCAGLTPDIQGTQGNDMLVGTAGDDIIAGLGGGAGDDAFVGGPDGDLADFAEAPAVVVVDLASGTASGEGADTLTGIENVRGSAFDDSLRGGAASEALLGERGEDVLAGRDGDDALVGGTATTDSTAERGTTLPEVTRAMTGSTEAAGRTSSRVGTTPTGCSEVRTRM